MTPRLALAYIAKGLAVASFALLLLFATLNMESEGLAASVAALVSSIVYLLTGGTRKD